MKNLMRRLALIVITGLSLTLIFQCSKEDVTKNTDATNNDSIPGSSDQQKNNNVEAPSELIDFVKPVAMNGQSEFISSLISKNDGGFLITGTKSTNGTASTKAVLINVASNGDTLWTKYYSVEGCTRNYGIKAVQLNTGNIVLSGNSGDNNFVYEFTATFNQGGSLIGHWEYSFLQGNGNSVTINRSHLMGHLDKYNLVFGFSTFNSPTATTYDSLYVLTFDNSGVLLNDRGYNGVLGVANILKLEDESLIIPLELGKSIEKEIKLIKIDADGNETIINSSNTILLNVTWSLSRDKNENFLITGTSTSKSVATIYQIGSSGAVSRQTYADTLSIENNFLLSNDNNGYLFMNFFNNYNHQYTPGYSRIYLTRMDENLKIIWTAWISDEYHSDLDFQSYVYITNAGNGTYAFTLEDNYGGIYLAKTVAIL